jgi:CheY-like chemotaxis protein
MTLPDLADKKLLVVEDDDMSFLYLNQLLSLTGALLTREKTGCKALERFRNHPGFDLVLMDIQLPDMNGNQVTREIRAMDATIPIIAQTAAKSPAEKETALSAGCMDILTKPFSMEELFAVIGQYIR